MPTKTEQLGTLPAGSPIFCLGSLLNPAMQLCSSKWRCCCSEAVLVRYISALAVLCKIYLMSYNDIFSPRVNSTISYIISKYHC